jgi:hypothetical protein
MSDEVAVKEVNKLPEGFEPIDPKNYVWEPGKIVRNQVDLIGLGYGWLTTVFTLNVVKPVAFDELRGLVGHAVKDFADTNEAFKKEDGALKNAIIKDLYAKLFAYWYKQLEEIKLVDTMTFAEAKQKYGHNGHGSKSES